mmetsp:Transcript_34676/g.53139  ORF Transcript_34676/g.53139 Transcript_34676/m.53139 type:complete len:81 (-) Transcript_34676:17-259(-)
MDEPMDGPTGQGSQPKMDYLKIDFGKPAMGINDSSAGLASSEISNEFSSFANSHLGGSQLISKQDSFDEHKKKKKKKHHK